MQHALLLGWVSPNSKGFMPALGKVPTPEERCDCLPEAWLQAAVGRGTWTSGGMAKSMAEGEKMQVRNVSVSSESLNLSDDKRREPVMRCPST